MAEPYVVIAITRAFPGQAEKLQALEEELVVATLQEPGCLRYELHQATNDENMLVIIEAWESEPDWRAHSEGAALQQFKADGGSQSIERLEIIHLRRLAGGEPQSLR
ncbi:MAG TPA: antibiotic biosynthesis monooxygenase family protein [Reyranella sp.]|nr:antibiotic biosynthesis monooxygenase family protein [Reyranella sp.]